jgi:hypothetical protein
VQKPIAASIVLLFLVLTSCSFPSAPTAIPTSTFIVAPLITATPAPTQTPDVVTGLLPEGQPDSEWNGIPIMPGAIAGEGDEESYVFTIKATPQQVADYYQAELVPLGWQPFGTDNKDASLMLLFMDKSSATLTINIIAKGDDALVLLVK